MLCSMALRNTQESGLIGGYEWAEGLQDNCEASGGCFFLNQAKALGGLGLKSNKLFCNWPWEAGEGHSWGVNPSQSASSGLTFWPAAH